MQSEVSQKGKDRYHILTHTHMYMSIMLEKMILKNIFARQAYRCRHREQTCGHSEGRREKDELRK